MLLDYILVHYLKKDVIVKNQIVLKNIVNAIIVDLNVLICVNVKDVKIRRKGRIDRREGKIKEISLME